MIRRFACFALLLFAAACAPRLSPPGLAIQPPSLSENAFIAADGAELPMRSWLPASGSPRAVVLALHGFNDYSAFFDEPGTYLAQQGVASFAYDQRGFGKAPNRGRWAGTEAYLDDLRSVSAELRKRHPGAPLYLLGESMGGAVVMVAAASTRPPEADGIILAAPAVWARETMPLYQSVALWLAAHTVPWMEMTGKGLNIQASDNIPMLRAMGRDPLVIKRTRVDAIWGLADLMDAAFAAAARLETPALILYGERDEVIPADPFRIMLAKRAPDVRPHQRVAIYKKGWHMLLRDYQAHLVWGDIDAWIGDRTVELPSAADARARQAGLSRVTGPREHAVPVRPVSAGNG